ncbi:5'-methylthioadenosine/S-adenosylhomocysteine nucleosidase [Paeniglutamicibacter cryotolerans]|uniref:adenosylhomocysteine nucleosidase n=1 Tax=Paeniglutamicibacter cryotolerans TaxID=670079 RepID=A0A839QS56_9MICC|nr:5'-methylthioadenosine/S-adenosylhomocysteine nucleosidase [Paeniglutamicibacter cryotolerans]MBB2996796.1 adenosylhomocysteine nucleosidase [Paeniglutamicibacter cryotolerans]
MSTVEVIVIAAMEKEITPFLQRATSVGEPVRIGNAVHRSAVINGRHALFVQAGIGLVNAAGAATSALLLANAGGPDAPAPLVISAGSAGGLGASVRVGDVVIGMDTINADADVRVFGYELGQVPGMPASYPVPQLLADASTVGTPGHSMVETVHHGLIVSSYAFIGHERATVIREQFTQVLATDMESSAIAQTCHAHGAPFLAIRGISDLCDPDPDSGFPAHVDDAAERSAEIATAVIGSWFAAGAPRQDSRPHSM